MADDSSVITNTHYLLRPAVNSLLDAKIVHGDKATAHNSLDALDDINLVVMLMPREDGV